MSSCHLKFSYTWNTALSHSEWLLITGDITDWLKITQTLYIKNKQGTCNNCPKSLRKINKIWNDNIESKRKTCHMHI